MGVVRKLKEEAIEEHQPSQSKQRKKMETGRKLLEKRPLASSHKTKKVVSDDPGTSKSCKKKRTSVKDYSVEHRANTPAMERAIEIQANLAPEFPSLVKFMLQSHVVRGFWLGLPNSFCQNHLPKLDTEIVLEDEGGKEYRTKYLAEKVGLSGGWRGFSIEHKLLPGDVAVFQLVKPSKFKVYIVRSNSLDEVDGALGLLNLEACASQMEIEEIKTCNDQKDSQELVDKNIGSVTDHSENDSDDFGSEVLEGIKFSESHIDFKEVNSLQNFTVSIHGLIIDSELSKHVRTKYYELCCSQKSFLHDRLLEGLNCKLAAGIISETVNIADAIKISKITTSQEYFLIWDKTLKAFEDLGMNVGFLRVRLSKLLNLGCESKRCSEASIERVVKADKEMRNLQEKLLEIKQAAKRLDEEIEVLTVTSQRNELMFQEEVNLPW